MIIIYVMFSLPLFALSPRQDDVDTWHNKMKWWEIGDRFFMYQITHTLIYNTHSLSHIHPHISENTIFNARVVYKMNELLQIYSPAHSNHFRMYIYDQYQRWKRGAPCVCVWWPNVVRWENDQPSQTPVWTSVIERVPFFFTHVQKKHALHCRLWETKGGESQNRNVFFYVNM